MEDFYEGNTHTESEDNIRPVSICVGKEFGGDVLCLWVFVCVVALSSS
jgi:hypothetical protein